MESVPGKKRIERADLQGIEQTKDPSVEKTANDLRNAMEKDIRAVLQSEVEKLQGQEGGGKVNVKDIKGSEGQMNSYLAQKYLARPAGKFTKPIQFRLEGAAAGGA